MKKFFGEFKEFISKGNVIDLAVGVIIGGAFSGIVTSLVENIITPVISLLTGKVAFADLFYVLGDYDSGAIKTLEQAQAAGLSTINYGLFIQAVIDFVVIGFVIFLLVKGINKIRNAGKKDEAPVEEAPTTKKCPFCTSEISIEATRCPHCTSQLSE
jgi:large conductance mechanosensitive channel